MASISALVFSYNQRPFIEQALESVARQTRLPDELIILDDASTDGSAEVIQKWAAGSSLRPILRLHDRNLGPTATFNEGMAAASCDYIAPLAADDLWAPTKLALEAACLDRAGPSVCAVYGDVPVIDEHGATVLASFLDQHHAPTPRPTGRILDALLDGNFIPGPSVMVRREHATATGVVDDSLRYEDFDFWLRMAARFEFQYIDSPTGAYRMLSSSLVRRIRTEMKEDNIVALAKLAEMGVQPRRKILRRLRETAIEVYMGGTPRSQQALRVWLRHDHSPTALAFGAITLGGVLPWRQLRALGRIRRALRLPRPV